MAAITIDVDINTEERLREMSRQEGAEVAQLASRLLARAVRAARPRPVYDLDALTAAYAEFAEEDEALAESGLEERIRLLAEEDAA